MRGRKLRLPIIAIALFATSILISCGGGESSPIESMKAPILLVRNDSITEVKDSAGKLYTLNSVERTDYGTAFLKTGDEIKVQVAE